MEYLVYSEDYGLLIIEAEDIQDAEVITGPASICLSPVEDIDKEIIDIVRRKQKKHYGVV